MEYIISVVLVPLAVVLINNMVVYCWFDPLRKFRKTKAEINIFLKHCKFLVGKLEVPILREDIDHYGKKFVSMQETAYELSIKLSVWADQFYERCASRLIFKCLGKIPSRKDFISVSESLLKIYNSASVIKLDPEHSVTSQELTSTHYKFGVTGTLEDVSKSCKNIKEKLAIKMKEWCYTTPIETDK